MAHLDPLQEADRLGGLGNGTSGPTFREGTQEPESWQKPPFSTTSSDEPGTDVVHEIDCTRYGYCYEPKGTARVSNAPEVKPEDEGYPEYNRY